MYKSLLTVFIATFFSCGSFAGYVQSDNIDYKVFKEITDPELTCNIETRQYLNGQEFRVKTDSKTFVTCESVEALVDKTETTVTFNGKISSSKTISYDPGIPFVVDDMVPGLSWDEVSVINGNPDYKLYSFFEAMDYGNVNVPAGSFENCLMTTWEFDTNPEMAFENHYSLWWCEDVGLVRYEIQTLTENEETGEYDFDIKVWELDAISYKDQWQVEQHGGFEKVHIYKPEKESPIGKGRSLLIMLEGCIQTSDEYTKTANFEKVADEYGMVIALPEAQYQTPTDNVPMPGCWIPWEDNKARNSVDYGNILQLVANLLKDESMNIDPDQVYISGFSGGSGFAMPMACLAPDVFAGVGLASGRTLDKYFGAEPTAEEITDSCLALAGDYAGWFDTQITSIIHGVNDQKVLYENALLSAEVMGKIYGISKKDGSNDIANGGLTEEMWGDNRISLLTINDFGHGWLGGIGASGYYITDKTGVNYLEYLAGYFVENNKRVNNSPVISGSPETIVNENEAYSFSFVVTDDQSELPTITINNKPSWANFDPIGGTLTGTPGFNDAGVYNDISICAFDGVNTSCLGKFSIEVINVNRLPVISGSPAITVKECEVYTFEPVISDPDEDSLTVTIENKPSWAEFDAATGKLSGIPGYKDSGVYSGIVITVSDRGESVSLGQFVIEVVNVNQAPRIAGVPAATVSEQGSYSFTPEATDSDGDSLTFSITKKPEWADFDGATGVLTGTPGYEDSGLYSGIVISVTDGYLSADLPVFSIEVTNRNRQPEISGAPLAKIQESESYSFTPDVNDADGDRLTFSITNKPEWADFDSATGTLSGDTDYSDAGLYSGIVITVSDGSESAALAAFDIEVINNNRTPVISGEFVTIATVGKHYSFIPMVQDGDVDDSLSFSADNLPEWLIINIETGEISGTPSEDNIGVYEAITLSVTDGYDTVTTHEFSITVTEPDAEGSSDDNNSDGGGGSLGFGLLVFGLLAFCKKRT